MTHYRGSVEISEEVAAGYLTEAKQSLRAQFVIRHGPDLYPDTDRRRLRTEYRYDPVQDRHWIDIHAYGPPVGPDGPKTFHQDQPDQTGPGITNQEGK